MKGMDAQSLNEFRRIAASIAKLNQEAVAAYQPVVEDLCQRQATEKELEHCFDGLLGFVGDKSIQKLFNRLCQKYLPIYPDCIAFYIKAYKEETQEE